MLNDAPHLPNIKLARKFAHFSSNKTSLSAPKEGRKKHRQRKNNNNLNNRGGNRGSKNRSKKRKGEKTIIVERIIIWLFLFSIIPKYFHPLYLIQCTLKRFITFLQHHVK